VQSRAQMLIKMLGISTTNPDFFEGLKLAVA